MVQTTRAGWRPFVAAAIYALAFACNIAHAALLGNGLLVSPTLLNFGDVAIGTTSPGQQITITNTTAAPISLSHGGGTSDPFPYGPWTCVGSLAAGASCTYTYSFAPTSLGPQSTPVGTSMQINGVAIPITLTGNGTLGLMISPRSLNFGDVAIGSTSPGQQITITNTTAAPISVGANGGTSDPFPYSAWTCGGPLAAGASCTYTYSFAPTSLGPQSTPAGTSMQINGVAIPITLTGNGVNAIPAGSFFITPRAVDFGDVAVGTSSQFQYITISNATASPVPLAISTGGSPGNNFWSSSSLVTCGTTLAAGATCIANAYKFLPLATGAQSIVDTITINGTDYSVALSGNGVTGFTLHPTTIDFGPIGVGGHSAFLPVTMTNTTSGLISSAVSTGGSPGNDFRSSSSLKTCGATLASGATCIANAYQFRPLATGAQSINDTVTLNGLDNVIALAGTGASLSATPNAFTFVDINNATPSTDYISNAIAVVGLNSGVAVAISAGNYRINGGAWTNGADVAFSGDAIEVQLTSSATASTTVSAVLTVGGISDSFDVTSAAAPVGPSADPTPVPVLSPMLLWLLSGFIGLLGIEGKQRKS